MSRALVAAESDYLGVGATPVTAAPLTIAGWFQTTNLLPQSAVIAFIGNPASSEDYFNVQQDLANVQAVARDNVANAPSSVAGVTVGAWHHGVAVFTDSGHRTAYLDGVAGVENGTAVTPAGVSRLDIGRLGRSVPTDYFDGKLAEVAVWDVALSPANVADLAAGMSPLNAELPTPVRYWRFKDDLDLVDLVVGEAVTNSGSTWDADHPAVEDPPPAGSVIFPASSVLDDFNRADGAVGAPWVANPDGVVRPEFNVASNQCVSASAGAWMYYDDFYDGDSENFVTVPSYTSGIVELERIYGAGTVDWGGYAFMWYPANSAFRLVKYATGGTTIPLTAVAGSFGSGDSIGFRIVRNGLFGYHKPSGGEWSQVLGFIDPGFTGAGKPALYAESASTVYDDWGGGLVARDSDVTLLGVG